LSLLRSAGEHVLIEIENLLQAALVGGDALFARLRLQQFLFQCAEKSR
jgi:hypothetical protein